MKQLNQLFLFLLLALTAGLSAQAGNTITFEENSSEFNNRTLQLTYEGMRNGRNHYTNRNSPDVFVQLQVFWDGNRWIITDGNDNGGVFIVYANNYDVGPNPPSLDQGNWEVVFPGEELVRFEGNGTQEITLDWNLTAGPFSTTDGVQTGLGGATPTGGTYTGEGVTDDGNGMTFTFDPAAAGPGLASVSYGGGNMVIVQTIEVTQGGDVINFGNSGGAEAVIPLAGEVNGRNSYSGFFTGSNDPVAVSWSGTRWEIIDALGVAYFSNYDTSPNPPNFATGNWNKEFGVIDELIELDGSGTQAVTLGFTLDAGPFTTTDGILTGLGGGTPTGGVYFGPGVTDEGNGMTFSFDPAAAGAGNITISYGDGPDGANNVTQTVEVLNSAEVCLTQQNQGSFPTVFTILTEYVVGQNFTACSTGRATRLQLRAGSTGPAEFELLFNRGNYFAGPDYTQQVAMTLTAGEIFEIELTEPFIVEADSTYAFALRRTGGSLEFLFADDDPFAGGNAFDNGSGVENQYADLDVVFRLITEIDEDAVSTRPVLDGAVTTLTAFPNPTDANFTVSYDLAQPSDVTVVLYDARGRKLRELPRGRQGAGVQRVNVTRAGLPAGMLFYGLVTERGASAVRPIVLR